MNILALTLDELVRLLQEEYQKGAYHGRAIYHEVFKAGNLSFACSPAFAKSQALGKDIERRVIFDPGKIVTVRSEEGVVKFVTQFHDGVRIESVIIPMKTYATICVSCQAGCRMGCLFCETGRMGFIRDLAVEEIVGQLFHARFTLKVPVKNVVFMGMGEPLDNLSAVIQAINIMNEQRGFDIALRHITLSTVGLIDGIKSLGEKGLEQLNLAISLNAADDGLRNRMMPVNRKNPLHKLKNALMAYPYIHRKEFLVSYVLIKDLNDSPTHARAVGSFLAGLPVRLNLIPYNGIEKSQYKAPTDLETHLFARYLEQDHIFVRKRWRKGRNILAGCGQLGGR